MNCKLERLVGRVLCRVGLHRYRPSTLEDWRDTRVNFRCTRCAAGLRKWPPSANSTLCVKTIGKDDTK